MLKAESTVSIAEPVPHYEAIKVKDNAQKGRLLPAKKKFIVFLFFFSIKTIKSGSIKYSTSKVKDIISNIIYY